MNYAQILFTVLPIFLLLAMGAVLRVSKMLPANVDQPLMKLVFNFFLPALIFEKLIQNDSIKNTAVLVSFPVAGFITIMIGFAIASTLGSLLKIKDPKSFKAFTYSSGLYNCSFMALPLIQAMFPERPDFSGLLFLFNTGIDVAIWSVGIIILSGFNGGRGLKHLLNAPLITLITAVTMNLTGVGANLPHFIIEAIGMVGQCAIPIGILLSGCAISEHAKEMDLQHTLKAALGGCLVRNLIAPLVMLFLAFNLSNSKDLSILLVIQSGMPAAMFSSIIVKHYKCSVPTSLAIIITTTCVALLTTPLWISYGMEKISTMIFPDLVP